jgi:molecular chaperone GrpE
MSENEKENLQPDDDKQNTTQMEQLTIPIEGESISTPPETTECVVTDEQVLPESPDTVANEPEVIIEQPPTPLVDSTIDTQSEPVTDDKSDTMCCDAIMDRLQSIEGAIQKRLAYDESKEKIIDKLHSELQRYKSDIYAKLTDPIFRDICAEIDGIRQIKLHHYEKMDEVARKHIDTIEEGLMLILDKYHILPFTTEPNTRFSSTRHRKVNHQPTDDDTLVGLVARSISSGFSLEERVIFAEKVTIYSKGDK